MGWSFQVALMSIAMYRVGGGRWEGRGVGTGRGQAIGEEEWMTNKGGR